MQEKRWQKEHPTEKEKTEVYEKNQIDFSNKDSKIALPFPNHETSFSSFFFHVLSTETGLSRRQEMGRIGILESMQLMARPWRKERS